MSTKQRLPGQARQASTHCTGDMCITGTCGLCGKAKSRVSVIIRGAMAYGTDPVWTPKKGYQLWRADWHRVCIDVCRTCAKQFASRLDVAIERAGKK